MYIKIIDVLIDEHTSDNKFNWLLNIINNNQNLIYKSIKYYGEFENLCDY